MYSQEVADKICNLLAQGKSLRSACEEVGAKAPTILDWVRDNKAFSEQYARARELGYMHLADEMISIADTPVIAEKTVSKATGLEITTGDAVDRSRLMVDTRKWMLARMLPKIYGDKVEQTIQGPDGGPVSLITRRVVDPKA